MDATLLNTHDDATTAQRAFVTANGIPFALEFPEQVLYPTEGVSIDQLLPNIVLFGRSSDT